MQKLFLFLFFTHLASCANQKVILSDNMERDFLPAYKQDQTFFLSGVAQKVEVPLKQICGSNEKTHSFEVRQSFVNGLLHSLTYGIYSPREAAIYCVDKD